MSDVAIAWIDELHPLEVATSDDSHLFVASDGSLQLRSWAGEERVILRDDQMFAEGPHRACSFAQMSDEVAILLLGEEGTMLVEIDLHSGSGRRVAEVPRANNDVGGMCFLRATELGDGVLVRWELGVLVLDSDLSLRWRQDLEWNHQVIQLDDRSIWFDLKYEAIDDPQRIGDQPYGFSLADGHELLDEKPSAQR